MVFLFHALKFAIPQAFYKMLLAGCRTVDLVMVWCPHVSPA